MPATHTDPFGQPLRRVEDERLVTGQGRYVADLPTRRPPLHLAVLRSPHPHAEIAALDTRRAAALPGVAAVLTATDLEGVGDLPCDWVVPKMTAVPRQPVLAQGRVRYVGQPVAAVAAETPAIALDALELLDSAYAPLTAATTVEAATSAAAPNLHESVSGNRAFTFTRTGGGDFEQAAARAALVLRRRIVNNRLAPVPLEGRAVLSDYDRASGRLVHHTSTQLPHVHQRALAEILGWPLHRLHLVAPDVGGGFGAKLSFYAEDVLAAWLTLRLERPVRWIESRSEGFLATTHGRDHVQEVELAAGVDGTVLALRARITANLGAYALGMGPGVPAINTGLAVTGAYRIPIVDVAVTGVYTNSAPVGPYRGAGHPEATYLIERMMDDLARELGLDPVEVRRRNFIPTDAFPYRLPTGMVYDSGDLHRNLDTALDLVGYAERRAEQAIARRAGRHLGIGLATYVELSGAAPSIGMGAVGFRRGGHECARVVVHPDGTVTVFSGAASHGQGHATSLTQIAAQVLGIDPAQIEVVQGDTASIPFGTGTFNSRTMAVGGTAVHLACTRLLEKATSIAANLLQRRPGDLAYAQGRFETRDGFAPARPLAHAAKRIGAEVKGMVFQRMTGLSGLAPASSEPSEAGLTLADVAAAAHLGHNLPLGMAPGLDETVFFDPKAMTASSGTHVAVVEVDAETGRVTLLRHVAVEDCGRVVNPLLATGQVHGGAAQGIGQALLEQVVYDAAGQLITGSLADYAVPRAADLPSFETAHTVTPSPLNPLGVKGIGEGATIGAPPAIVAAALDALGPLGVTDLAMPLTSETVWRAIRVADGD